MSEDVPTLLQLS